MSDIIIDEKVEIIGVRFTVAGKVYYFAPGDIKVTQDELVIVETARGLEIGNAVTPNSYVPKSAVVEPLRKVVRIANDADIAHAAENKEKEKEAFGICAAKIEERQLDMRLIEASYTFDNSKLLFYFTSDNRVDFRELVKELASLFKTRIELRQIGIRDEAKMLGGIGMCGRAFCCCTFLPNFTQVSIKMAKEQNFSLNSAKISGSCGRLMCCMRYEHETYEEAIKKIPSVHTHVKTPDGNGVVVETNPLAGSVKVRLADKTDQPKSYKKEDLEIIKK